MKAFLTFRTLQSLVALTLCLLIFASCKREDVCPRGHGPVTTRTVSLPAFDGIEFTTVGQVEYIFSSESKIEIEAEENMVSCFKTQVKGNKLVISSGNNLRPGVTPKLRVYSNQLTSVNLSGSGEIRSVGNFVTAELDVRISGSGFAGLYSTQADQCIVRISGSGDCEVSAKEELIVDISGSGNVYYHGWPAVNQHVGGSGSVISRN
jgi:hypothetical protein